MKRLGICSLVGLSLFVAACYTVPESGRQSFILPLFDEVQSGAQAFADMKTQEKVSTDAAAIARVDRVGKRIAAAVGDRMPNAQWEFVVFDAPQTVNAFALPGGKVGVYTGLLNLAKTDDELAFVMGHEIGHVTSRHGAERATEAAGVAVGGAVLAQTTKDKKNSDLLLAAYGLAATGATLKFSRSHESEADYVGLRFSAYAGYDPRASVTFWQKMAAEGAGKKTPEFLSTHPSDDRRISALQQAMPEAIAIYEANKGKYAK